MVLPRPVDLDPRDDDGLALAPRCRLPGRQSAHRGRGRPSAAWPRTGAAATWAPPTCCWPIRASLAWSALEAAWSAEVAAPIGAAREAVGVN